MKVVRIDGNRIPAPNQLTAIHIDHVDRADFFRWEQPGVVALDRESIPDQLVIHLQSRVVDRRRLARSLPFLPPGRDEYRQTGDDARSLEVRALAESWVEGVPRGIAQVERIVERLRSDYVLDDEARAAGADGYTVAEFQERLKVVPAVRSEWIEDCGHMLHHDQPQVLARLIENFLD